MCGICGIYRTEPREEAGSRQAVRAMTRLMVRRGPDDEGYWDDGRCFFGFRRLAILDLTAAGRQPMMSGDGRSVIVFNGELYNFQELRHELEKMGIRFRSRTDTEVALEALNQWGERAIERFNGMFGLAWYQVQERRLVLARDHAGIKPLFYRVGPAAGQISFASQLNCLILPEAGGAPSLREDALGLYLRLNYFPWPYTLYEGIHQLPPGHLLVAEADGGLHCRAWWRLPEEPAPAAEQDERVLDEALAAAVANAVRRQRIADVPVGVFLSGGVDSPLVAAVARQQCGRDLKTFTIGTPEWTLDESEDARRYAELLDVTHRLLPISEQEVLALVDEAARAQTEPFADYSMLPTMLVSRLARTEVVVALSGDGGDELFFGYERPFSLGRNGLDFRYPYWVRWLLYAGGRAGVLPKRSGAIMHRSPESLYLALHSHFASNHFDSLPGALKSVPEEFSLYEFHGEINHASLANFSRRVEFYGQLQRVLRKVDMASMHYSLEVRVPLLDREVIEASLAYDGAEELKSGKRKRALRRLLARHVGEEAIPETKRGFGVPLGQWLRGALRERAEEELLGTGGWVAPLLGRRVVEAMWREHVDGQRDHKWALYSLLALEWWKRFHERSAAGVASH
jgi:asparagine synthase (glutamine-hydrolysing)